MKNLILFYPLFALCAKVVLTRRISYGRIVIADLPQRFAASVKEALINSATHLHTSTLSSRRRQILDVATATPAVCLLY